MRCSLVIILLAVACSPEEVTKRTRGGRRTMIGDACSATQNGVVTCDPNADVIFCNGVNWVLEEVCPTASPCQIAGAGVASCSGGGNTNTGSCSAAEAGDTDCLGDSILVCNGTDWVTQTTCGANMHCEVRTGGAVCVADIPNQPTCATFTAANSASAYDPDILPYATLRAINGAQDTMLVVDNWGGLAGSVAPGQSDTVPIAGNHAEYNGCGVCIWAMNATEQYFFARSGTASIAMPASTGGVYSATLSNVRLEEMTADGALVPGGNCIQISSVTIGTGVPTSRWGCGDSIAPGQSICASSEDGSEYDIWSCGSDELISKSADCDDQGMSCSQADDPAAFCR